MKLDVTELVALAAVAGPFIGFGAAELTGQDALFIIGVGLFIAWMFVAAVAVARYRDPSMESHGVEAPEETASDA